MEYLTQLSVQIGIPVWALVAILLWSLFWKLSAFWKSARKGHLIWFLVFAFVHTMGILEILYVYLFSERNAKKPQQVKRKRKIKKKK